MADEKDRGKGTSRSGPWDPVVSTVVLEMVGLGFSGIVALLAWPFGWLPDPALVAFMTGMFAVWPAAELYRAGPSRRFAVVAALLALAAVTLLVAAAVNWAFPAPADPGVGLLVGVLAAAPLGVAVLAWLLNRANAA